MATAGTTTDYREAHDSLARAIGRHRTNGQPGELARELLAIDTPGHTHLVGIDYAATRAMYFHCLDGYAIAVSFDEGGLEDGGPRIATTQDEPLCGLIERWDAYWGWLHPRYR